MLWLFSCLQVKLLLQLHAEIVKPVVAVPHWIQQKEPRPARKPIPRQPMSPLSGAKKQRRVHVIAYGPQLRRAASPLLRAPPILPQSCDGGGRDTKFPQQPQTTSEWLRATIGRRPDVGVRCPESLPLIPMSQFGQTWHGSQNSTVAGQNGSKNSVEVGQRSNSQGDFGMHEVRPLTHYC